MARPEKSVEDYLVERVEFLGGTAEKVDCRGNAGKVDRVVVFPAGKHGRCYVLFVECKALGKKPRPLQRREHRRLAGLGFVVALADSIEAVDDILAAFETH